MATQQILAERRAHAASKIDRRAQGIARALKIEIPARRDLNYPDAEHRRADEDDRIVAILTSILRKLDVKAPELTDPNTGVINETVTVYGEPDEKGNVNAQLYSQPLKR
jgi:hypothetical protein